MIFLIGIMSFANFVFYPLVIGFFIALIIEQIFRSQDKVPEVLRSMAIRKYLWRQAWICLLYTSPSPRDRTRSRMPSSA